MAIMPISRSRPGRGDDAARPLAGLRALDLGFFTAGPLATRLLGDLGADVVKVEPPAGDPTRRIGGRDDTGTSYLYCANNAGKRGIALDLKSTGDLATVHRLVAVADIVVANFTVETMDRLDLGWSRCGELNPRLVYCLVTGYGADGPFRGERAMDMCVQARSAMMAITGSAEQGPTKIGISVCDDIAASCAAMGVLAALVARARDGAGRFVDAGLLDTSVWATQYRWPPALDGLSYPDRLGNADPVTGIDDVYPTRDGHLAVSLRDERDVGVLGTVLADPVDPGTDPRELLRRWAIGRGTAQAERALRELDIPCAAVARVADVATGAQARARRMLERPGDGGPAITSVPFRLDGTRPAPRGRAPRLDEDRAQILADWLGERDRSVPAVEER